MLAQLFGSINSKFQKKFQAWTQGSKEVSKAKVNMNDLHVFLSEMFRSEVDATISIQDFSHILNCFILKCFVNCPVYI